MYNNMETPVKASSRPGRGFLFRNQNKLNVNSPDFRGKAQLPTGEPVSVAAWEHEHGISVDIREWVDKPEQKDDEEVSE